MNCASSRDCSSALNTFGNLLAAQFFAAAKSQLPDLEAQFATGSFDGLKSWLNENIHHHGQRWRRQELCERVTGSRLSADALMKHLEDKLRPIYGM